MKRNILMTTAGQVIIQGGSNKMFAYTTTSTSATWGILSAEGGTGSIMFAETEAYLYSCVF